MSKEMDAPGDCGMRQALKLIAGTFDNKGKRFPITYTEEVQTAFGSQTECGIQAE